MSRVQWGVRSINRREERESVSAIWDGFDHITNTKKRGRGPKVQKADVVQTIYKQNKHPDFRWCYHCAVSLATLAPPIYYTTTSGLPNSANAWRARKYMSIGKDDL